MGKVILKIRNLLAILLIVIGAKAYGQSTPASVLADQITFSAKTGILVASGNVRIFYDDAVISADSLTYNQKSNELEISGPFILRQGDSNLIQGDGLRLTDGLQNSIILGAQAVIDNQLQISSREIRNQDDRYTQFSKVVASTCHVCEDEPVPFWQIRANRIIYDKDLEKLYFEEATLDILGLGVFYLPRLSTPEPGIRRASGFLTPNLSTSNVTGIKVSTPYFWAISDHSDATITPSIFSKGDFILEGEFRKRVSNGGYRLNGAIALADQQTSFGLSGFLEGQAHFTIWDDYQLEMGLNITSENGFKEVFNYSDDDRFNNFARLSKTESNSYFEIGTSFTQSLRPGDSNSNTPFILPEFFYTKTYENSFAGGRAELTAQSVTLLSQADGAFSRIGGTARWQRNWVNDSGFIFGLGSELDANIYSSSTGFTASILPTIGIEGRYPLKKQVGQVVHVIEPIAQVFLSPNELIGSDDPGFSDATNDSTTVEFEETNLFSSNRFPGFDRIEAGIRANVGIRYLRYRPDGWQISATFGRVFRKENLNQFPVTVTTGLDELNSDFVGAFAISKVGFFSLKTRALFDSDFNIAKNETSVSLTHKKLTASLSYIWLDQFSVLNLPDSLHEAQISAKYSPNEYWSFTTDWRQNLETGSSIEGGIGVTYENECAKIDFSYRMDFEIGQPVEREFGLRVALAGFGSKTKKQKFSRRCGALR